MLLVRNIRLPLRASKAEACGEAMRRLGLAPGAASAEISKISVDARHGEPTLVYTVAVTLPDESAEMRLAGRENVSAARRTPLETVRGTVRLEHRPVVCGLGPAGLFCALLLAREGYRPIVLERGPSVDDRMRAIERFSSQGELDENANVQFGEGGAGTFSDGKLTTRIGSPLCDFVTQTLLEHGAPEEIAWQAKPHIGTDRLPGVVRSIREQIESLGGRVLFRHRLEKILAEDGRVQGAIVQNESGGQMEICTGQILLAIGHSARDTFEMLYDLRVPMIQKAFSIGARIEHRQRMIDHSQYGAAAGHPALGAADYKLSCHLPTGRSVYTFCMCPGGSVVASASEPGSVVTNGMSAFARDGENANSALLVGVGPGDFGGDDPLAGVRFQQHWERAAFLLGGGDNRAPAQRAEDFLKNRASQGPGDIAPSYRPGVRYANLSDCLPGHVVESMRSAFRTRC